MKLVSDSRKSIALSIENTTSIDSKIDPQFMQEQGEAVIQLFNFVVDLESKNEVSPDSIFKSIVNLQVSQKP